MLFLSLPNTATSILNPSCVAPDRNVAQHGILADVDHLGEQRVAVACNVSSGAPGMA